tara:strand:- start:1082 stop:2374 length:1293 start_codon:yes stop_codon:yes gene_type:complete
MNNCIDPVCYFSNYRKKCIKPNPYIEQLSECSRNGKKKRKICNDIYRNNKDLAKKKACERYHYRMKINKKNEVLNTPEKISKLKKIWKKVKLDTPRKKAAKKIVKYALPFITRAFKIENRIKYAKKFIEYIKNLPVKQKLTIIKKNNYEFGNGKIKLIEKIGSESKYGAIYLVKYNIDREIYKVAAKVFEQDDDNKIEIKILSHLTNIVLNNKNPHYAIMYKNFKFVNNKSKELKLLPKPVQKIDDYFINLNEMFSGDLKTFVKNEVKYNIYKNTLEQIIISILSFHNHTSNAHNDAHWGNFLYHKIKPGGYIHYNIYGNDIYVENLGYLWVIWDYGFASPNYGISYNKDLYQILGAFQNIKYKGWIDDSIKVPKELNINIVPTINNIIRDMSGNNDKLFLNKLLKTNVIFDSKKPINGEIINKIPYILK